MIKICTKCKIEKELSEFKKAKSRKFGRSSWCKSCHSKSVVTYQKANRSKANYNNKKWKKRNPEAVKNRRKYDKALRRARLANAKPQWVDNKILIEIYKNCPEGHHVDHIIPLKNEQVCGLHVPWNLQYLPAEDNIKKSNKLFD